VIQEEQEEVEEEDEEEVCSSVNYKPSPFTHHSKQQLLLYQTS